MSTRNTPSHILTINGGSSSLKFALFDRTDPTSRLLSGRVDPIGLEDARWVMAQAGGGRAEDRRVDAQDQKAAVRLLIDWLERAGRFAEIAAVGHRVVHGGESLPRPRSGQGPGYPHRRSVDDCQGRGSPHAAAIMISDDPRIHTNRNG